MDKEQLRAALKERGINYHHMHNETTLQRLLDEDKTAKGEMEAPPVVSAAAGSPATPAPPVPPAAPPVPPAAPPVPPAAPPVPPAAPSAPVSKSEERRVALTDKEKAVAKAVMGQPSQVAEKIVGEARAAVGGHVTKNGVYLPHKVTKSIRKRIGRYEVSHEANESVIFKNGTVLRRYNAELHGENYQDLAEQFLAKHSKK